MAPNVVIVNAKLKREQSDIPWGFRMIGGADQPRPQFSLETITPDSLASRAGLQPGDVIFIVNEEPLAGLTHEDACEVINSCGDDLKMRIKRIPKAKGGLGQSSQQSPPSAVDQVAKGISQQAKLLVQGGQPQFVVEVTPSLTLSHTQVNTPLNIYSEDALEDTINDQLSGFISKNPKFEYLQA